MSEELDFGNSLAVMARMWRQLYNSLLSEGFNEADALKLVQSYILSMTGGVRI
jgi:hypothetical protein